MEKEFLPGLLAENRDGNGSLPRSRNLISEKVFARPTTLYGRGRADMDAATIRHIILVFAASTHQSRENVEGLGWGLAEAKGILQEHA